MNIPLETKSPSPSPSASPREWATYADPGGDFQFDYPAGWNLLQSEGEVGPDVTNYTLEQGDRGWAPGMVKIELNVGPSEDFRSLEGGRSTTVSGRAASYAIYRAGHKFAQGGSMEPGLKLIAMVQVTRNSTTYGLSVRTGTDPPSAEEDLFWELIRRFKLK